MIRLILTGGLGNQMFEYAAAKSLATRLNTNLEIDLYALDKKTKGTKRNLELNIFDLDITVSKSYKTIFIVKCFPLVDANRAFFEKHFKYFRDFSAIVYAPAFEKLNDNTILHGHFQNERYFANYAETIRKDFTFKKPLDGKNLELADKIESTESVAIHIRRGDYLTDAMAKNNFAVCDQHYYQKAIEEIYKRAPNPKFFIFSEDIEWAKENLSLDPNTTSFVDWNTGNDSYLDMQLMSMCKHTIIANSSFSWWAAWLNTNNSKTVIAPNQWFREKIRNKDLSDFYPKSWTII